MANGTKAAAKESETRKGDPAKTKNEQIREKNEDAQSGATEAEKKKIAKGESSKDDFVDLPARSVSSVALDPNKVKAVHAGVGVQVGQDIEITLESDRVCPARVIAVHPGKAADEDLGLPEITPTLDVKAFTGNPNTGGYEEIYGLPVSRVSANADISPDVVEPQE